jgi:hypothetical protein
VGLPIDFALEGAPGSLAALFFATDATLVPFEPWALGSFLVRTVITAGPLFIPSSGTGTWPFWIPSSYPLGETYYWQFATVEPSTNRLWLSNALPLHVDG